MMSQKVGKKILCTQMQFKLTYLATAIAQQCARPWEHSTNRAMVPALRGLEMGKYTNAIQHAKC